MSAQIAADPVLRRAPATSQRSRFHIHILWMAITVIAIAEVLQVLPDGRIALIGWESSPLPHTCVSRRLWNVSCPGCGLTRSFVYLAHGQWRESLTVNRVGWVLALLVAVQIPYRILCLARPRSALPQGWANPILIAVACLLMANWLVNLVLAL